MTPQQAEAPEADLIAELREVLWITRPDADVDLIRHAYDVAAYWHHGQTRQSGDAYITHPVAVATILARLNADDPTLCTAMLHDTIDDTPCELAALSREFGTEIAAMVGEFTRLHRSRRRGRKAAQAMAAAVSRDTRVLAVSLADRLHNMRTLQFLPQATQLRKAREVLDFFVPVAQQLVAQQLRMDTVPSELETLASAALARNRYARAASGRLVATAATLLPAATRNRWREEWLGELQTLPTRKDRGSFAAHTALGMVRLALTLRRRPAGGG
jgi:(p)ppGpp synthase/HD superfamily hydrolase